MKRRHRRGRLAGAGGRVDAPAGAEALPDAFRQAARAWLGDEAAAFLEACAHPPALALRANERKGGLAALYRALEGVAADTDTDMDTNTDTPAAWPRVPWWPRAILAPADEAARLAGHVLARIGALYAQDPAALAAVAVLDPRPGERVLDLCGAPGGKSTAILDRLGGGGLLVANDVDARRARELGRTLERWGAATAVALSLPPERLAALVPGLFDRVLVDAPCSGEAMFARHSRAAADWSPGHVEGCAARQRRVLDAARVLVRPGGILVYATCTFNPVENEAVIAAHLAAHPGDTLEDAAARLPGASPGRPDLLDLISQPTGPRGAEVARCARLWPHRAPGAGHFIARMRVDGTHDVAPHGPWTRAARRTRTGDDARGAVRSIVTAIAPGLTLAADAPTTLRGDQAFLVPAGLPTAVEAAAFMPGLAVAERRGRTWRPAHALAMALRPAQARRVVALDDGAAAAFLAGRPVAGRPEAGAGVVLVTWRDYPLGWARARDSTLTSLLPKGLLIQVAATPPVEAAAL